MAASVFQYWDGAAWAPSAGEAKVKAILTDSISQPMSLEVWVIDDFTSTKLPNYVPYRKVRLVNTDLTPNQTLFFGRIEFVEPDYDPGAGQIIKITARDYLADLTYRKMRSNHRKGVVTDRGTIIKDIINYYQYTEFAYSVSSGAFNYAGRITIRDNPDTGKRATVEYEDTINDILVVSNLVGNWLGSENIIENSGGAPKTATLSSLTRNINASSIAATSAVTAYYGNFEGSNDDVLKTIQDISVEDNLAGDYVYDFYLTHADPGVFTYFRRGTLPTPAGKRFSVNYSETQTIPEAMVASMMEDYKFYKEGKEIITHVDVIGENTDYEAITSTKSSGAAAYQYKVFKDAGGIQSFYIDVAAQLDEKAQAFLDKLGGSAGQGIIRGNVKFVNSPIYKYLGTYFQLRAGELVKIKNSNITISGLDFTNGVDMLVIKTVWEEPPGITSIEVVASDQGIRENPNDLVPLIDSTRKQSDESRWLGLNKIGVGIDTVAPATPAGLAISSILDGFKLTWSPNSEKDLAHYNVYRSADDIAGYAEGDQIAEVKTTYFIDTNLGAGVLRYYKISAVDLSGNESALTASVNATSESLEASLLNKVIQPYNTNLLFSATGGPPTVYNQFKWDDGASGNGTIKFADGVSYTITAGTSGALSASTVYYAYTTVPPTGADPLAVTLTTTYSSAIGSDRLILAIVSVGTAGSSPSIFPFYSKVPTVSANILAADIVLASFIRTASSGTRVEISGSGIFGYNGVTTQFSLAASDGRATCGAGAVILDASGVTIQSTGGAAWLTFLDSTGAYNGYVMQNGTRLVFTTSDSGGFDFTDGGTGVVWLSSSTGGSVGPYNNSAAYVKFRTRNIAGSSPLDHVLAPSDANYGYLGDATYYWKGATINTVMATTLGSSGTPVTTAYVTTLGASGTPVTTAYITTLGSSGTKVTTAYTTTTYFTSIGPLSDAATYCYFRTKNIAGDTIRDHIFAPSDTGYGYLGDAGNAWRGGTIQYLMATDVGSVGTKVTNGYFTNLPACPLPTVSDAFSVIKKIKNVKLKEKGAHGDNRYYIDDEDMPDECKMLCEVKDEKGDVVSTVFETEYVRTIGVLVKLGRELVERIEALENKMK